MKGSNSLRKKISGSGSVLSVIIAFATAGLIIALTPVASGAQNPSFFQGFEVNSTNWFEISPTIPNVTRVQTGDQSTTYNSGTTSVYGVNPISAASGDWFGRVTSRISTGSCTRETGTTANGLICQGPYTFFGLKNPGDPYPVFPFPTGGYTTQVDIYLDVTYPANHPDCGQPPPSVPCTPQTPGTKNPACITMPSGIDCEGSRFDWTLGVSKSVDADSEPGADFLQDYVFSVGTSPDPFGVINCPAGWIVTAGYNSFRSGGDTYNTGTDASGAGYNPKCLSTSGWYTFKQVFKDDGTGHLEVDFYILDPSGNVVNGNACADQNGNASTCSWIKHPVYPGTTTPIAISDVGCPRYGWLANEEINDLPLDNTKLFIEGCGLSSLPGPGQITPTDTTCLQYSGGTAGTLDLLQYTVKAGKINSVSPGVFFYYTYVSGAKGDTVTITESHTDTAPVINIQKLQAVLYSTSCTKVKLLNITDGSATGTLPSDGLFIIGVKYDASSLKGKPIPGSPPITYTFDTLVNGTSISHAEIDLNKK